MQFYTANFSCYVIEKLKKTVYCLQTLYLFTLNIHRAHYLHRKGLCISCTLGDDMLASRCLMLYSYLIDRYFSVHLTTNIGDIKLSINVVYGRNGLRCPNSHLSYVLYVTTYMIYIYNTDSLLSLILSLLQRLRITSLAWNLQVSYLYFKY